MKKGFDGHSFFATDIRFVVLYFVLLQGRLNVPSHILEVICEYLHIGHEDERMRFVRPTIRSLEMCKEKPLSGGKLYYDYKDYAQMGIAENSVAKYAAENLTEEQAQVVNKSLSDYISGLLDSQEEWINSECIIDDREGIGDTGEMNTYYAVRHVIPQWMQDKIDAEFDAAFASVGIYREHTNSSADSRNRGLIYCASNKDLAGSIRSLFAGTDITNASQLADAFKEYKDMMTAAYRAVGFGRTTNDMLKDDTNSFTKQVSNMKAVLSGINRNGIDSIF